MDSTPAADAPVDTTLLVAFVDARRYLEYAETHSSRAVFELFAGLFAFAAERVAADGGRWVKCIGDAGLFVFPAEATGAAVDAIDRLRRDCDSWLAERGYGDGCTVTCHLGPVTCGPVGAADDMRWDVYGATVNAAATLPKDGLTLSPAVYAAIPEAGRGRFARLDEPEHYARIG